MRESVDIRDGAGRDAAGAAGRGGSSADEVVKAALGILKLSGIEREKPRPLLGAQLAIGHDQKSPSQSIRYFRLH